MTVNEHYTMLLNKAMALCAGREMCRSEMMQKLDSWGSEGKETERILDQLVKDRFIDEERFASAYVQEKFRQNKWGKIKIASELGHRKIPAMIISKSLQKIDPKIYSEVLKTLIENHRKTVKARNMYELKGKLLRYALSKGYESHLVYDILNEREEGDNEQEN